MDKRGLRASFSGRAPLLPSLLLWQMSIGRRKGPLPRPSGLAITEPKSSLARGTVVPMSFQHKINCLAHQLARGHRRLPPERTYSDVETSRPAAASAGSDPSGRRREHDSVMQGPRACLKGRSSGRAPATALPRLSPVCQVPAEREINDAERGR